MTPEQMAYHDQIADAIRYAKYLLRWKARLLTINNNSPAFHQETLIKHANLGWGQARDALFDFANTLTKEGKSPPMWLQEYIVAAGRDVGGARRGRGGHAYEKAQRDLDIVWVVSVIAGVAGFFDHTRSPATADKGDTESACSIVATALKELGVPHASEPNVNRIWKKYRGRGFGSLIMYTGPECPRPTAEECAEAELLLLALARRWLTAIANSPPGVEYPFGRPIVLYEVEHADRQLLAALAEVGNGAKLDENDGCLIVGAGPTRHALPGDAATWLRLHANGLVGGECGMIILTERGRAEAERAS